MTAVYTLLKILRTLILIITVVLLNFFILNGLTSKTSATAFFYKPIPEKILDTSFNLKINGISQPLQYHHTRTLVLNNGMGMEIYRIRFAQDSPSNITLEPNFSFKWAVVRTTGYDIPTNYANNKISFTTPTPGIYRLYIEGLSKTIYIFVDPVNLEKPLSSINVNTLGIVSDPNTLQTTKIQQALDSCNKCTLYFPPGIYRTGRLVISRPFTSIYLADGSLIKGPNNFSEISPDPNSRFELILIYNTNNIKIYGLGVIDANGDSYVKQGDGEYVHNINIENSSYIGLRDFILMNSNSWALHIKLSNNIFINNMQCYSGKDCFDFDSSSVILVENAFAHSIDDSFVVKSRFRGVESKYIVIKNCYATALGASALKIGTEVRAPISNVSFRLCDVDNRDRAMNLNTHRDTTEHISFVDFSYIRIYGGLLAIKTDGGGSKTEIHDIKFSNIITEIYNPSIFNGIARATLSNFRVKVPVPNSPTGYLFSNGGGANTILIENPIIYWQNNRAFWAGISDNNDIRTVNAVNIDNYIPNESINFIKGDYNIDGKITFNDDILPLLKFIFTYSHYFSFMDTDSNSKLDVLDIINLIRLL